MILNPGGFLTKRLNAVSDAVLLVDDTSDLKEDSSENPPTIASRFIAFTT